MLNFKITNVIIKWIAKKEEFMKKTYIYIICLFILIVAIIIGRYYDYKNKKAELDRFNLEYEQFTKEEIYGTQLATVINKEMDNNEKFISNKIKLINYEMVEYLFFKSAKM